MRIGYCGLLVIGLISGLSGCATTTGDAAAVADGATKPDLVADVELTEKERSWWFSGASEAKHYGYSDQARRIEQNLGAR